MAAVAFQTHVSILDDHEASSDEGKKEYSIIHFQYSDYSEIRKIPTGQIYKETLLSRINFLKGYKIKIVERSFEHKNKDIYLLSRDHIRSHRSKYKFLHIGLVQVSIMYRSPVRVGETFPVSVSLRDSKYPNYTDSVLVALESDVYRGDIKFNWFPNFSSPLSDLANSNALVVTIDPQGSQSVIRSLRIKYRVCYKLMKTSLRPKYLFENPVLEVNTEKTDVVVPKPNNQT